MKDEKDIQLRQALMTLTRVQNEAAYDKSQFERSVSFEEHEAVKTENESLRALLDASLKREGEKRAEIEELMGKLEKAEGEIKDLKAEVKGLKKDVSDLEDTNALLTADRFGPSSEVMERIFGKDTDVPKDRTDFLAMLSQKGYDCDKALRSLDRDADRQGSTSSQASSGKEGTEKRKPRGKDRRRRAVWVKEDSIVFPVDDSNIPKNARLVARQGEDGIRTFRLLYIRRMKVFSAAYRMARYNVPGEGQKSSRYPDTVYEGCHLTPSFIGAYHRFKFQFNVPEQSFLKLPEEGGCRMEQSSLNQMVHADMSFIRGKLEKPMLDEIKASPFTHNDETRLSVKYGDRKTGKPSYHDGYVHGILSPSASLVYMTYQDGSRKHDIQEEILRDSRIMCFTSDKATMYRRIIKDIGNGRITVGYCWGHGRRELYHAYQVDRRLRPVIELIGYLFDIERQCREEKLDAEKRRARRQDFSRPVVDMVFAKLRAIVARPKDFGKRVTDACSYFLNDEEGFRAFLDNGLIELHNNPIYPNFWIILLNPVSATSPSDAARGSTAADTRARRTSPSSTVSNRAAD